MLEQRLIGLRGSARRAAARLPLARPALLRPARLVLRIDASGLPGAPAEGPALDVPAWARVVVDAVHWLGPVPVTALGPASEAAVEALRVAHRLDCPTTLDTDGRQLDGDRALWLVDCGVERVRVEVDPDAFAAGDRTAREAVGALLAAREDRGRPLDVEVVLPWVGRAAEVAREVRRWAQEAGVDGFRVRAPHRARDLPADPEVLDAVATGGIARTRPMILAALHAMVAHQDGGIGVARERLVRGPWARCPVGGERIEVGPGGAVASCPFQAPVVEARGEPPDLRAAWAGAGPHLRAIRACERCCVHDDLAPRPVVA